MGPAEDNPSSHRRFSGARREALLGVLGRSDRPLDATELGRIVGLHRNSVRAHLEALVSAGLAQRRVEHRATRGRPRVVYERTATLSQDYRTSPPRTEVGYQELAHVLAGQMAELEDVANEAIRAGRRWAAAIDASPIAPGPLTATEGICAVADVFEALGFGPELRLAEGRILLHHCPFAAVAKEAKPVVCGMHLGMLKATLERLDTPLQVTEFRPLAQGDPLLCIVGLGERASRARPGARRESDNKE